MMAGIDKIVPSAKNSNSHKVKSFDFDNIDDIPGAEVVGPAEDKWAERMRQAAVEACRRDREAARSLDEPPGGITTGDEPAEAKPAAIGIVRKRGDR
jgi:hypothetical protein